MKLNKAQLAALAAGATEAEIAALATVADPADAAAGAGTTAAAGTTDVADAGTTTTDTTTAGTTASGTTEAADTTTATTAIAAAVAAAAPAVTDQTAIVDHLKAELVAKDTALIAAKVEAETFKAQAAAVDGLVTTLRAALGEKLVALGASADVAAGYSAANIVAEYARIDAVFKKQFRVGGVAAVASPEEKDAKPAIDPMLAEALKHSLIK
jgi:hypothetical protein